MAGFDFPAEARSFAERARLILHEAPRDPAASPARAATPDQVILKAPRPAAVLYPIIARPEGLSVLLTERAGHLSNHAGQVAFPGGRIEHGEAAQDAALREAEEEIGLDRGFVRPIGFLPTYYTGTGFQVQPMVGLVDPAATFSPDPGEVTRVFEIPLVHALNLAHYRQSRAWWRGAERVFYILDHDAAFIWGVTAGIMRIFAERY